MQRRVRSPDKSVKATICHTQGSGRILHWYRCISFNFLLLPEAFVFWIKRRITSQDIAQNYYTDTEIFLSMECNTSQEPSDTAGLVGSPNKFQQEVQPTQALNNGPSNFNLNGARIWKKALKPVSRTYKSALGSCNSREVCRPLGFLLLCW